MVYKHRMKNGKIRHYQSKNAYQQSLKGMFANMSISNTAKRKIAKAKAKRQMKHRVVGNVSSGKQKFCDTCRGEGLSLTEGKCKVCAESFASFKQPEPQKIPPKIDMEARMRKITAAVVEDNSNIGNIMNTNPEFKKTIDRQILKGMLELHSGWVNSVGREAAIKDFNEDAWGDAYFVLWGYQNGDNHAFIENRMGDRFALLRNVDNAHDMRLFENGQVFEADLDAANQIAFFDYHNNGFSVMFWDFQQLREQGHKLYEDRAAWTIRPPTLNLGTDNIVRDN